MPGRRGERAVVNVAGRSVAVSSLDRVLWPALGFSKKDAIEYLVTVADHLLPHLRDRPLTLKRAPEGAESSWWYQTDCPHPPEWIETIEVDKATGDGVWRQCTAPDAASLVWLANIGALELHPLLFRRAQPFVPVEIVFDLDPGAPADLVTCCKVALVVRDLLAQVGLQVFVNTSGGVGLHLHVPVPPVLRFEDTARFARGIAHEVRLRHLEDVTLEKSPANRRGKVLIDWQQNGRYRSLVAPYSLRLMKFPTVAAPLSWEEVEAAAESDGPGGLFFLPGDVLRRLGESGDPMRGMWGANASVLDLPGA